MAEEQNWEETSNHTPCANNCGFFGSPTTRHLCSKCYKDNCVKEQHMSTAKLAVEKSLFIQPETSPSSSTSTGFDTISETTVSTDKVVVVGNSLHEAGVKKTQVRNRCGSCKRRVGLTGFTCKCGTMFCGTHRYPEKHGCTFDFKTVGKEAIAKANPVIKAEKLNKI